MIPMIFMILLAASAAAAMAASGASGYLGSRIRSLDAASRDLKRQFEAAEHKDRAALQQKIDDTDVSRGTLLQRQGTAQLGVGLFIGLMIIFLLAFLVARWLIPV